MLDSSYLQPEIDRGQAFLIFATFGGDVERTAHALGLAATAVLRLCDEEGWHNKLEPILRLKKSTKPGDYERAMNRVVSFVQAHRLREFLERILRDWLGKDPVELRNLCMVTKLDKEGKEASRTMNTRPFADLATALQKAHDMAYAALNDTVSERVRRNTADEGATPIGDLHIQLSEAIAKITGSQTPRARLFDEQLHAVQELTKGVEPESDEMEAEG